MAYDCDYPKKPLGGSNPYYACAYCGMSDPQINGNIKNHLLNCEYRKYKENEFIPMHPELSWNDTKDILNAEGWYIIQKNPLILQDGLGHIEEGKFAQEIVKDILYDYQN